MLIVLNNKCHFEKDNFTNYIEELNKINTKHNLVLCPSPIFLNNINLKDIELGSQNVSSNSNGAYTGEASAKQLKSFDVRYCLVGHSERRNYQKETNKEINLKIKQLLSYNITPILCVGEEKTEKEENKTKEKLHKEIKEALIDIEEKENVIIAYEPIWAIGTGDIPTTKEIEISVNYIKEILPNNKIIYGGSITDENISLINKSNLLNGYLLGGISLHPNRLDNMLNKLEGE